MKNIAYIFPGQGSQQIGMLQTLTESTPLVDEVFSRASDALGYDLWDLVQNGPEEKLNQTEYTQAAMLTSDVAVFEVIQSRYSIQAKVMAGHSLGEYAALVCSGALSLADGAKLVSKRGQLMQEFVPLGAGAMAAIIGLENGVVDEICQEVSQSNQSVSPANYNAIGQVVIAGHTPAVEQAVVLAEERGARMARIIPVSVPCHCDLLEEAANHFSEALASTHFQVPENQVISNVDLSIYTSVSDIKKLLAEQLYKPVRWVETILKMKDLNINQCIESGPGKVLTGLIKRIDKTLPSMAVNTPDDVQAVSGIL